MKHRLFIHIKENTEDPIDWGIWNKESSNWIETGQLLPIDMIALAEKAKQSEVIVIIPANMVNAKVVHTPSKRAKQIYQSVPFMLEEQLAANVDDLHFAYGARDKKGNIAVQCIDKDIMDNQLHFFQQNDIVPDWFVHELSLIDKATDTTEILLNDGVAFVNDIQGDYWNCQRDLLPLMLNKKTQKKVTEENKADDSLEEDEHTLDAMNAIRIFYTGELEDFWKNDENVIANAIDKQEILEIYARNFNTRKINLLQREYATQQESSLNLGRYKTHLLLGAMALVIHLSYQGSRWYSLTQKNEQLVEQGQQLYKKAFNKRRKPSDLLIAVQKEMRKNNKNNNNKQEGFLELLDKVAQHIHNLEHIRPTNLVYDNKKYNLKIDLLGKDLQTLNTFKDTLNKNGLFVENTQMSQKDDKYTTRFTIGIKS